MDNNMYLSKSDIAKLYFPDLASHQACNRLRRWIKQCNGLEAELLKTGYHPTQRLITPKQRDLIFEYLGDPFND